MTFVTLGSFLAPLGCQLAILGAHELREHAHKVLGHLKRTQMATLGGISGANSAERLTLVIFLGQVGRQNGIRTQLL